MSLIRRASARRDRRAFAIDSGEPLWYAAGWSDTNFYQGPSAGGRAVVGTVRLVGYWIDMPTSGVQKIIAGRISAAQHGWRINTGLGAASTISVVMGGSLSGWQVSPTYTVQAGDIGELFVLHTWPSAVDGVHMAIGGAEVGAGSGSPIITTEPAAGDLLTLGRYQHAGGFGCPHIGIVSLCASPTVMTLPQIAADAAAIMASGRTLVLPTMPGEDMRFVAYDARPDGGNWRDRDGDDCTLAENGTVTFTAVP